MATAKPQVDLECPVCHEDFAKPKFLPCAHVICNKCVLSWLSTKGDGGCPLCRAAILPTIQPEPSDIATLVDDLPTDLATTALVESQKALSSRHVCNVCADDTVATSYCLDCGIMLCKFCSKAHGRVPVSRDHVLEDLSTLTAERLAASRRSPCDSHPDRPAELYCGHHQTIICNLCATSKHRACHGVVSVGDMAGQARAALTEQVNRLKEKEAKLRSQIKQLEQEMKDTQAHFSDSRSEVKTTYDRLHQTVEKRRQEIDVQLEQEEKKAMAPKQAEKTQLERNMVSISAHVGPVERLVAIFADSAVVGMLDKLKTRLDELETQIQPTEGANRGSLHSFVISDEDLTHLEREITSIGQITSTSEISSSGLPVPSAQNDTGVVMFDPMTVTPRRVFVFRPDAAGDTHSKGPLITAIIATQDGRLVMADYNNKMVKVADMTNPLTVHGVTLDDAPRGLALLHDGRVAVTSRGKSLYLVDVSGHPSVVSRVQTARQYRAVSAGTTDDTLIVSCETDVDGPARVDVVTHAGVVIQTVIDSNTLRDMSQPHYLCVCGRDVLVSDFDTDTVYRVELATGRVVDRLTHPNLMSPGQVTADPSGNVYIACGWCKCVLVMSADRRWRRLLEGWEHGDGRYVWPRAVCIAGSRLVVAWGYGDSVVAGYELV